MRRPKGKPQIVRMATTGYCDCKKCTDWKRNWLFRPVYAKGPNKGKSKKVGVTADGSKTKRGVLAADTTHYPFGTIMYIPGYGYGQVHDRGGKIKGPYHIDLYFPSHKKARKWGRQTLKIKVWRH